TIFHSAPALPRAPHSFPTRRSSDLIVAARGAIAVAKGLRRPRVFRWIVVVAVVGNAAIYLVSDAPISARDIARHDRGIDEKAARSEEHTSELQSRGHLVCRLLLEKK